MYQKIFQLQAELLKALANPKRLEIVQLLRDQELSVTQIQDMLGLPQANLSQHLMVLREIGVVKIRKAGKQVFYKIADKDFVKASDLIRGILIRRYKDKPMTDELTKKMTDLVPIVHDPVCQMRISPKTASEAVKHNSKVYYFCASGCKKKFISNPNNYLKE